VFEYAEGMPASDVGWGQLTAAGISQITRLTTLVLDLENRTPYLARVESSNLASHIVRSMVQAATGNGMTGSLASPSTKVILLIASDVNVTGLAALFHLDWVLPDYQADYCGPGGALVFQLRQSQTTGEFIVRASYIAQTLDQLRNQTPLTLVPVSKRGFPLSGAPPKLLKSQSAGRITHHAPRPSSSLSLRDLPVPSAMCFRPLSLARGLRHHAGKSRSARPWIFRPQP